MLSDPTDILKTYLRESIIVRLRSGEQIEGLLLGFDEYHSLLIALDLETMFIRGENIVFVGQK